MEKSEKNGSSFHQQAAQRKADQKMKDNWLAVQRKKDGEPNESSLFEAVEGTTQLQEAGATIQRQENKSPNSTGMPDQLKSGIESLSGQSMDDVKVHYNSSMPAQLQAHAYAQGTDIHLASGQEKHLPHEAWHVVQQKEGRVKPTKQLKGANINDDSALEKEADVMGAKAMQMKSSNSGSNTAQLKNNGSSQKVMQRYALAQDTLTNEVYNKSTNGNFVVGIGYPNHELYVDDDSVLDALNNRVEHGLLEFHSPSQKQFNFGTGNVQYHKVMPRHKSNGTYEVDQNHLNAGIKNVLVKNQAKFVAKSTDENYNEQNFEDNFNLDAKTTEFTSNTASSSHVYDFSMMAEFIRKSFSQLGYTDGDDDGLMEHKTRYVAAYKVINKYLKGKNTDKTAVIEAIETFKDALPDNPVNLLLQKVKTKATELRAKANNIPDASDANLLRKGHLNHQFNAIDNNEFLLPRGCDLVAGTTMGVENKEEAQGSFAMRFSMKSHDDDHVHFSTKLLADSTDFVTIEGFAKGSYNIFDDTWEFFLHGNKANEKDAFNDYTMSRYDFFDFKAEYMQKYDPTKQDMRLGVQKYMEAAIPREAMKFYNDHIVAGGGQATLKDKATRDFEAERAATQACGEAYIRLNSFPAKANCVQDDPQVGVMIQQAQTNLFNPNGRSAQQINTECLQAFDNILSRIVSNHLTKANSIARARNVYNSNQDENHLTRIQAWIDQCTTNKSNLKGRQLIAKAQHSSAITNLTQIKNKLIECRNYRRRFY
ncbi:eCIS core domain-containing protein [Aureibacter tunicatorum]|uniref:eCIS core domain-containing protein n=1 Tax=Aureibacter tunicatorum TaxID=866807 RepID=A0AAE3XK92_9BACT|nr:DUF4157 domain-containing protein [Aureibacter tunicatorum]MDR6237465.1 hypothetical protein [Aureibacter tunicatorum]BDD06454.1 hypothetical protein AUTU_39370 [Aureibacter tunicatorum]